MRTIAWLGKTAAAITVRTAVLAAALLIWAQPATADDPDFLTLGLGYFDYDDDDDAGEFRLEYRSDWDRWFVRPFSGVLVTTDSALYGYGGILLDLFRGKRIVTTPSFAVGYYSDGNGKNLGSSIELQSRFEIAYRFANRSRFGLAISHISNAGIDDTNPGTNSVTAYYAIPFDRILRQ